MTFFKALDLDGIGNSCMYPGLLSHKRKYIYFFAEVQAYLCFQLLTTTKSDTWGLYIGLSFKRMMAKSKTNSGGRKSQSIGLMALFSHVKDPQ